MSDLVELDSIVGADSYSFGQKVVESTKLVDSAGSCLDFGKLVVIDSFTLD